MANTLMLNGVNIHTVVNAVIRWRWPCILAMMLVVMPVQTTLAHSLVFRLTSDDIHAISVNFDYSGAAKEAPRNAMYQVYGPGDTSTSYQSGQTDRFGRVSFLPNRPGKWRVELRDEEGHEIVAPVDVTQEMVVKPTPRWGRWLFLASIIVNLTLILFILQFRQEKKQAQSVKS